MKDFRLFFLIVFFLLLLNCHTSQAVFFPTIFCISSLYFVNSTLKIDFCLADNPAKKLNLQLNIKKQFKVSLINCFLNCKMETLECFSHQIFLFLLDMTVTLEQKAGLYWSFSSIFESIIPIADYLISSKLRSETKKKEEKDSLLIGKAKKFKASQLTMLTAKDTLTILNIAVKILAEDTHSQMFHIMQDQNSRIPNIKQGDVH